MQTALEVLRKHTGLTVTDLDAVRMQTEIKFVEQAMQEYAKLYACEKVKEALNLAAERLPSKDTGRSGCSYGDTEFDSESVVYGFNMAIDYCGEKVLSLETEILTKINKEI